jgi:HEAT repeat protein
MAMVKKAFVFLPILALAAHLDANPLPPMDLDIGVPMGTPLDWDRELHQPIPTSVQGKKGVARPVGDQGTMVATPAKVSPPPMGYTSINLYNFLRVRTIDIMTHFTPKTPTGSPMPVKVPSDQPTHVTGEPAAGKSKPDGAKPRHTTMGHGIDSNYPPKIPGELFWIAIANCLRSVLHPELMCEPESIAYLVEIGEVSLHGAETVQSPWSSRLKSLVKEIPATPPDFPTSNVPIDNALIKLAVMELVSGYPFALDPRYAKRTLLLGDQAFEAVLKCAQSKHLFLSRNAVAVLANFSNEKAAAELSKIAETATDPVVKVRAIAGIGRRKDKKMIPILQKYISSGEDYIKAIALYALGNIATKDAAVAKQLVGMAKSADLNSLWTILPAIARIACNDKEVIDGLKAIYDKTWGEAKGIPHPIPPGDKPNDFRAPNPEPAGYKKRIIADMALVALAASGDPGAQQEIFAKFSGKGVEAFTEATWLVLAESLPLMGEKGQELAKSLSTHKENALATQAVRSLRKANPVDTKWLSDLAKSGSNALVRAAALTALFGNSDGDLRDACHAIIKAGGSGNAEEAYLVAMAIQMLDYMNANDGAELLAVVEKANAADAVAKRMSSDEYDITKAKFDVFPPLLEVATLALGKTGHEPAIPKLIELAKSGKARAEAALALGGLPAGKDNIKLVVEALLETLTDQNDGWLRFCSYLALKNISNRDFFADYIFGAPSSIYAGHDRYKGWLDAYLSGDPKADPKYDPKKK